MNYKKGFTPLESPAPWDGDEYRPPTLFSEKGRFKTPPFLTGFTLIEILVAMTAFLIVIGAIFGIFVSGIRQQQRILATQALLDQTSYSLEFMSRALRMAKKELNSPPACLSSKGLNYEYYTDLSGIKFINVLEDNDCQAFYLEAGQLKYQKDLDNPTPPPALDLTSDKLEITSLKFNLSGESQTDNLQPRVTIAMEIRTKGLAQGKPVLKIQTTISQRNLDVQY